MIEATATTDGKINLIGKQGTTWDLPISLYEDSENTIPFSLDTYFARGQYRKNYNINSPILIEFTCTVLPFDAETNPDWNKIIVHADPELSTSCTVFSGVYDIEVYQDEFNVERVLEGTLVITPEVTK